MKIPVGRKPALDSGREASTSGDVPPAWAREGPIHNRVPNLLCPVMEQSMGPRERPTLPAASRNPVSLPSGLEQCGPQEFALAWDHADLAARSTVLSHWPHLSKRALSMAGTRPCRP